MQKSALVWAAPGRFRWGAVGGVMIIVGLTVVLPLLESGERLRELVERTGAWFTTPHSLHEPLHLFLLGRDPGRTVLAG